MVRVRPTRVLEVEVAAGALAHGTHGLVGALVYAIPLIWAALGNAALRPRLRCFRHGSTGTIPTVLRPSLDPRLPEPLAPREKELQKISQWRGTRSPLRASQWD